MKLNTSLISNDLGRRLTASLGVLLLCVPASLIACSNDDDDDDNASEDSEAGVDSDDDDTTDDDTADDTSDDEADDDTADDDADDDTTDDDADDDTADDDDSTDDDTSEGVDSSTTQASGDDAGTDDDAGASSSLGFFVTSQTSTTGNLGGIDGADDTCAELAAAVGAGDRTWAAYLSAGTDDGTINARERIGSGPWYNANGLLVASDLEALHSLTGDPDIFVDENGDPINGQWNSDTADSNEHDILTGSTAEGMLMVGDDGEDRTCQGWTSESADDMARVGHSDGLGPNMNSDAPLNSWNSVHESGSCADTSQFGGAGRFYCFAAD